MPILFGLRKSGKNNIMNIENEKGRQNMGIFVDVGNENFQSTLCSKIYVDKTGLLEYTNSVLNSNNRYVCVSRPRRFGKSITADMLSAYYGVGCNSSQMFSGLKIETSSEFEKYLNQYHVIQVDMNSFLCKIDPLTGLSATPLRAVQFFQSDVITELRNVFPQSVKADDIDLPTVLARINQDTGEKFVIIIDEWDAIFRENRADVAAQEAYIELLRGLFKNAPSKKFVALAYLTGILPIKKYGTQSALNNFDEFTMVDSGILAEYVGFNEQEVKKLCDAYEIDFSEMKRWYDGYELDEGMSIYSPKSVVDAIRMKKFANYWTRTETYESLRDYIVMNYDGLKDAIVTMIAGGRCKVNPLKFQNDMVSFQSKDDILTLLIHLGYLAYDGIRQEVYIPNEEIRGEFCNAVEETGWDTVVEAIRDSEALLRATWNGDEEEVARRIAKVQIENASVIQYNDENSLSCIITLAYYNAMNEYTIVRELPTGKGFADMVFLPRRKSEKPAMVIELKWNQSAHGAIEQIREREYVTALKEYKGNILLVGINYDKKMKDYQCVIEQVEQ